MSRKTIRRLTYAFMMSVAGCEVSGNIRYTDPSTGIAAEVAFKPKVVAEAIKK